MSFPSPALESELRAAVSQARRAQFRRILDAADALHMSAVNVSRLERRAPVFGRAFLAYADDLGVDVDSFLRKHYSAPAASSVIRRSRWLPNGIDSTCEWCGRTQRERTAFCPTCGSKMV